MVDAGKTCPKCGSMKDTSLEEYSKCYFCKTQMTATDLDSHVHSHMSIEQRRLYAREHLDMNRLDINLYTKRLEHMDMVFKKEEERRTPKCPKCGSKSITAGQRGFSIITGFIGSGATVNRCANCGYKWKP